MSRTYQAVFVFLDKGGAIQRDNDGEEIYCIEYISGESKADAIEKLKVKVKDEFEIIEMEEL